VLIESWKKKYIYFDSMPSQSDVVGDEDRKARDIFERLNGDSSTSWCATAGDRVLDAGDHQHRFQSNLQAQVGNLYPDRIQSRHPRPRSVVSSQSVRRASPRPSVEVAWMKRVAVRRWS